MREGYTEAGLRIEGPFENARNARMRECFKAVLRKVFGVQDVIIGHHLVYVTVEKDKDGFDIQIIEEIPAADTLIFDHDVARKLWGDEWQACIAQLASTPATERDDLFRKLWETHHGS